MKIYEYDNNILNFYEVLINYYSKKYNITDFENIHTLLEDNNDILTIDNKEFYNNIPIFGKTDRQSCFVTYFHTIYDSNYTILYMYLNFIKNNIKPLFPEEEYLVIQKTPNIRFHLKGHTNIGKKDTDTHPNIIGVHKDADLGHSREEINVIVPITKMYETNSIFYEPYSNSNFNYEKYNNLTLSKNHFFMGNFNQCKHYNKINKTDISRVSFDFRIIPYSKYIEKGGKFSLSNYYMLF